MRPELKTDNLLQLVLYAEIILDKYIRRTEAN